MKDKLLARKIPAVVPHALSGLAVIGVSMVFHRASRDPGRIRRDVSHGVAAGVLGRHVRARAGPASQWREQVLAALLDHPEDERVRHAKAVAQAIDRLRTARPPAPQITDDITQWFAPRAVRALRAHRIGTLADLTVRVPRRRQWWKAVPGLGAASARAIEAFFAAWPALTEMARALIIACRRAELVPWESLQVPQKSMAPRGPSAHRRSPARSTPTTTIKRSRPGCHYTNLPPRSAPTARKPSA
jgi:hypothetical protein